MAGAAQKRMQQRRGTSEEWASLDPVLLAGELGIDTTQGIVKVGDGQTSWLGLMEIGGGVGDGAHNPFAWTVDVEQNLGNGAYGMRRKGSAQLTANRQTDIVMAYDIDQRCGLMSWGGWWNMDGTCRQAGGYWSDAQSIFWVDPSSNTIKCALVLNNSRVCEYDVWVMYTRQ